MEKSSKIEFQRRTIGALLWSGSGQFVNQLTVVAFSIVLARLLTPSDFGRFVMVTVFTGYANILIDLGFGSALIQKKDLTDADKDTVFWITLAIGVLLSIVVSSFSGLIEAFYGVPNLAYLVMFLSFTIISNALVIVPNAMFSRVMDFKGISLRRFVATVISFSISVCLAILGFGTWALAIQFFSLSAISLLLVFAISSYRPSLRFSLKSLRDISPLSLNLFFNSTLGYITANIDSLIVGKYFGQSILGFYNRAYSFIALPANNISTVFSSVFLPAFSSIQEDSEGIRDAYTRIGRSVAICAFLPMTLIAVQSEAFVNLLLGPAWLPASPYVSIFSLSGAISSINALVGSVIVSQSRNDLILLGTLTKRPVLLLAIFIGMIWGPFGIACGKLASDILSFIVSLIQVKLAIQLDIKLQIRVLATPAFAAFTIGLFTWFLISTRGNEEVTFDYGFRIVVVVLAAVIYTSIVALFEKSFFQDIRSVFKSLKTNPR